MVAVWGFLIAGVLFLFAGLVPLFREGSMDGTLIVLGVAALVIGLVVAVRRKQERAGGP